MLLRLGNRVNSVFPVFQALIGGHSRLLRHHGEEEEEAEQAVVLVSDGLRKWGGQKPSFTVFFGAPDSGRPEKGPRKAGGEKRKSVLSRSSRLLSRQVLQQRVRR